MNPQDRYPDDRPRAATIRSRLMLEVASELSGTAGWRPSQAMIRMRSQGEPEWPVTLFGSDSYRIIEEVGAGRVDIAIVNPAAAGGAARAGVAPFQGPIDVRAIATVPSFDQLGIAVHRRAGVESLDGLIAHSEPLRFSFRGARPDHSVHMVVDHLLGALGTSRADLAERGHRILFDEGIPHQEPRAGLIRDGEVDVICDEGIYNWVDLAIEAGYRFLDVPDAALGALEAIGYRRSVIEADRYEYLEGDVRTLDFSGFMIYAHVDTPAAVVEAFCRALHARRDRIPWQGGPELPLERMVVDAPDAPIPVPFHPAAERVWVELGVRPV